jgi:RHS repeat-associated protein
MGKVLFTKTWVWCGGTQPSEERDGDNQVTQRFFAQGFQTLASPSSLPVSFYYTKDHLGSIREVLDATGTLRARYDYDAWGQRTKLSGDLDADFGFTGHLHHKQTGLILTHYRAYDPRLGRWLSRDPLAEDGDGPNLYSYVLNDPINGIDPFGLNTLQTPAGVSTLMQLVRAGLLTKEEALGLAGSAAAAAALAQEMQNAGLMEHLDEHIQKVMDKCPTGNPDPNDPDQDPVKKWIKEVKAAVKNLKQELKKLPKNKEK